MKSEKLKPKVREFERLVIRATLVRHPSRTVAAKVLGITTETLRKKMRQR